MMEQFLARGRAAYEDFRNQLGLRPIQHPDAASAATEASQANGLHPIWAAAGITHFEKRYFDPNFVERMKRFLNERAQIITKLERYRVREEGVIPSIVIPSDLPSYHVVLTRQGKDIITVTEPWIACAKNAIRDLPYGPIEWLRGYRTITSSPNIMDIYIKLQEEASYYQLDYDPSYIKAADYVTLAGLGFTNTSPVPLSEIFK